jgi:glycosyltransferase involved in cell wall biosynthesis
MMRVLHVNSGNLFGGIEVLLVTLARHGALAPDMEMELAVCFPGPVREKVLGTGVPVHVLGAARFSRPWTVWSVRRRLRRLLAERHYDAVICHGPWAQAVFGATVRKSGTASVIWLHDVANEPLNWLDRWARRAPPDLAICNSDYTLAGLPRLYPKVRGERVYCPVSLPEGFRNENERQATRRQHGAEPEDVVILQVGRWESHKGHLVHMEALGQLAREEPGWVCWQVGGTQRPSENAYLQTVKEAARRHGVAERVKFLGYQADLRRILDAADIYCQPNIRPEPFGITFIEAMMAGLPVVATALGGAREIVNEESGLLVPPGNARALSSALRRLIENHSFRARLGRAGPARAALISDPSERMQQLARLLHSMGPSGTHSPPGTDRVETAAACVAPDTER